MDVNGTKFHLLYGHDDWGRCLLEGSEASLSDLWQEDREHPPLEWDEGSKSLRLAREVPIFQRLKGNRTLNLNVRRGAGRDRYGNWYWIDSSESGIRFLPNGAYTSIQYWIASDRQAGCVPSEAGTFAPCLPPPPSPLVLRGLAVTTLHYLVVGDVTEQGLLIFDLHRGGPPLLLLWPEEVHFTPWDLAPTLDGGVLVLDRDNHTYWALDAHFRLLADVSGEYDAYFQPQDTSGTGHTVNPYVRRQIHPHGYLLTGGSPPGPSFPVSIESGPDGNVLILESNPKLEYSMIYEYKGDTQVAAYSLQDSVEAIAPEDGEGIPTPFSVLGHDFAYLGSRMTDTVSDSLLPGDSSTNPISIIYVADHEGKQAFAFTMDRVARQLRDQRDYLPLRRWGGKALVVAGGQVFYDFADRWIPLRAFTECHYAGLATLTTPVRDFSTTPDKPAVPGAPFDSDLPDCIWHRLFLDAQIPQGTEISVRARASDDLALLEQTGWSVQPNPYLRSGGAEIPYYDPWADVQPKPELTGTWELLFQEIRGRYLQLEVTLQGTGRSTPALRALRAWYPRFSYLDHYFPTVYREDAVPASFLDRWLANFEGLYTNLEDKIEHVAELFDPRTAPAETLNWLACWFGLLLDPLWQEDRRRFFIRHIDQLYRLRGTVPGIEIAVRLYIDKQVDDNLFDLRCLGGSKVRIVEQFMTRGVGGLAYGDPADKGENRGVRPLMPLTPQIVMDNAHRFDVLVPHDLEEEQLTMVERIVALEKPAHTAATLKRYWDLFRVGEARLGLDTRLGESSQFIPLLLGNAYLADNYLEAPYPFDIAERMVLNRDHVGNLPAL